jgi:hypothetical protein
VSIRWARITPGRRQCSEAACRLPACGRPHADAARRAGPRPALEFEARNGCAAPKHPSFVAVGTAHEEAHAARDDDDFNELIGDDDGVFGCMSLLGCHDVCPKQLPLQTQIAFLRRKMVSMAWK